MAGVAQGIAHGNYAQVAPETGPDEVRALAESLNSMARQVQATQQGQRDFLANVSHELRTPLTSIQGFAQAISEGAADSPAAVERSATIIQGEAERMQRLVENLLALARLEANLNQLERSPIAPVPLLNALVEKFAPMAATKTITLNAMLPPDLPDVLGDGDQLAQVFTNLLDNALKHTPTGGRVTIGATVTGSEVVITVSDTGPGIPVADQARIFERFYQVDKSRARSGGVGLGLAISKEIIQAHGGRIGVGSAPNGGAVFTVWLPIGDVKRDA
jgi:signal transduction histidine kinase